MFEKPARRRARRRAGRRVGSNVKTIRPLTFVLSNLIKLVVIFTMHNFDWVKIELANLAHD